MKEIREIFKELLKSGKVHGHIKGPKDNVLVCDTMNDWVKAGNEIMNEGYNITSPGGYGGSHPTDRKNTWNKMWRSGTVCATVIEEKVLCFKIPQDVVPLDVYTDIVHKK
jgi:hypothetical protein